VTSRRRCHPARYPDGYLLRILDEREQRDGEEAEAVGAEFTPSLEPPYRWRDWADPEGAAAPDAPARLQAVSGACYARAMMDVAEDPGEPGW
jgi:hypothetical protein